MTENIVTFKRGGLDLKRKLLVNDVEGKQREIVDKTSHSDRGIFRPLGWIKNLGMAD